MFFGDDIFVLRWILSFCNISSNTISADALTEYKSSFCWKIESSFSGLKLWNSTSFSSTCSDGSMPALMPEAASRDSWGLNDWKCATGALNGASGKPYLLKAGWKYGMFWVEVWFVNMFSSWSRELWIKVLWGKRLISKILYCSFSFDHLWKSPGSGVTAFSGTHAAVV